MSNDAEIPDDKNAAPMRWLTWAICVGLLAIILFAFQSCSENRFFSTAFSGVLFAGASLLGGGVIGFLFGIPRTVQPGDENGQSANSKVEYRANTNLEQISDWLTKMLVGVGLTQLHAVPDQLRVIAKAFGPAFGNPQTATVVVVSILLYFSAAGFLFGFLWTRLYLAAALRFADLQQLEQKIGDFEKRSEQDAKTLNLVYRQLDPNESEVNQKELDDAIKKASTTVKQQVYFQALRTRRDAEYRYQERDKVQLERTIPVFLALTNADRRRRIHNHFGDLGYALARTREPNWKRALEALTTAIDIRGPAESGSRIYYELVRAVCRIMLDENNRQGKPVSSEVKMQILEDLKVCARFGGLNAIQADEVITEWMRINDLSVDALHES